MAPARFEMKSGPFPIPFDDGELTAIAYPASAAPVRATLVLAHGAGAGQRHGYMVATAERLRARGVTVVTFDFPYAQNGKKVPDKNDVLEACLRAVFDFVRAQSDGESAQSAARSPPEARSPTEAGSPTEADPTATSTALFVGGKSMGGRIASQVAAKGEIDPAGLVFLGYPLHPPGKPLQRRDAHLPKVRAPMLFVQGTRDAFGTPGELALLPKLAKGSVFFAVEGGDHSHAVPKKGAVPQDEVFAAIADTIVEWMEPLTG